MNTKARWIIGAACLALGAALFSLSWLDEPKPRGSLRGRVPPDSIVVFDSDRSATLVLTNESDLMTAYTIRFVDTPGSNGWRRIRLKRQLHGFVAPNRSDKAFIRPPGVAGPFRVHVECVEKAPGVPGLYHDVVDAFHSRRGVHGRNYRFVVACPESSPAEKAQAAVSE